MENQYQKWVSLSYLVLAALVGFIVFTLSFKLVGTYDLEARVRNIDLMVRGLSILAGGLVFLILYRNDKTNQFMNEVVVELSRVTWPQSKETASATFIVIIMVLISGVFLGVLDYVWSLVLKSIL
jgi:preprotein translocase subunit SecE